MSASDGSAAAVDVLVLGAGWSGNYIIPLLQSDPSLSFAATTRDGRVVADYQTIKFVVDIDADWKEVPKATTIILTFPTIEKGAVTKYVQGYESVHGRARWLQLGSTSIFSNTTSSDPTLTAEQWVTRHTPIPRPCANPRFESEFELLDLCTSSEVQAAVLTLGGLWGGTRSVRDFIIRIAPTKEILASKGSFHMVHGVDLARAIIAIHKNWTIANGERWVLTDGRVYDWWDLAFAWGVGGEATRDKMIEGPQPRWVLELMAESNIPALPRPQASLPGKHISSAEFWQKFGIAPWRARLEGAP